MVRTKFVALMVKRNPAVDLRSHKSGGMRRHNTDDDPYPLELLRGIMVAVLVNHTIEWKSDDISAQS